MTPTDWVQISPDGIVTPFRRGRRVLVCCATCWRRAGSRVPVGELHDRDGQWLAYRPVHRARPVPPSATLAAWLESHGLAPPDPATVLVYDGGAWNTRGSRVTGVQQSCRACGRQVSIRGSRVADVARDADEDGFVFR